MILAELKRLAHDEGLLENPDFEPRPVRFLIKVDRDGRALGFQDTLPPPITGQRGKPKARAQEIPRRDPGKTSGNDPDFLVEKAEYVFGVNPDDPARAAKRHANYIEQIKRLAEETKDDGALAVLSFLMEATNTTRELPQGWTPGDLFAFIFAPDIDQLVSDRPDVASYWSRFRAGTGEISGSIGECLVCGARTRIADSHPKIRYVPGGQTSGASLVSFNARAFESYGLERNDNAPVCQACADAYTTALNRLLHPAYPLNGTTLPQLHYRISADTVAVFWNRGASEFASVAFLVLRGDPEAVKALLGSPWKGRSIDLEDPAEFYLAILSGAQGRVILRDWITSTISEVSKNMERFFRETEIVKSKPWEPDVLPLLEIVRSLAVRRDDKQLPPNLAAELFEAILLGSSYARGLLQQVLLRLRADRDFSTARMAFIKALLIRNEKMEVTKDMDTQNTNVGYRLGRLFAVLERLQGAAIGDPNASIVDRFYGAASTRPVLVFPQLLGLAQHHASKAETGGYFQKLIGEIVEPLDPNNALPSMLSMKDQGLFALGYYQQRADLWKKKSDKATD
ncbi:MAG: type I-C CRISPR-associated protein Cas8c/Csd1 [Thermoanaerobaculia bacterium]